MVELLTDPTRCQVMLVTLPEETPVNELVDTAFAIEDRVGVALGPVVVNGCCRVDGLAPSSQRGRRGATPRPSDRRSPTPRRRALDAGDVVPPRRGTSASRSRRARLASCSRCRRSACRSCSPRTIGPAEVDVLADAFTGGRRALDPVTTGVDGAMHARRPRRRRRHVLVCCGTGGVGKTTTAAALAIEGARRGRDAVVVTIDPAKRLADTLGLEHLSNTPPRDRRVSCGTPTATPRVRRPAPRADARHEVDVRPARHAVRGRRGAGASASSTNALLPQHRRRAVGHAGVHGDGEALRAARRRAASTSSSSTRRPPATRSTSSTRRRRLTRLLDNRIFRLLMAPTRTALPRHRRGAAQAFLRTVAQVVGTEVIDDVVALLPRVRGDGGGLPRPRRRGD